MDSYREITMTWRIVQTFPRLLPSPQKQSDHSDRRQLAHAWVGGAKFFATRDASLLDHADDLLAVTGMHVLRPSDVVTRLEGDAIGADYAPIKLHGTKVERRAPASESELYPFQQFKAYEEKSTWLELVRKALVAPRAFTIELLGIAGELPRVAIAVERTTYELLRIHFLRSLSSSVTGTLLRRIVSDLVDLARQENRCKIIFDDIVDEEVRKVLEELDFHSGSDGVYARQILPTILHIDSLSSAISLSCTDQEKTEHERVLQIEAKYWPLKITGASVPCYIVPIRPYWAASLFDRDLASRDLFDFPVAPALGLENVYYSASNIAIPTGSRIVWYVSGSVGQVRAFSKCLGTDVDSASSLSRKYHRLGAYKWSEILAAAKSNPGSKLHAYRFHRTEVVQAPLDWAELKASMVDIEKSVNNLQSPVRISEMLFESIYRKSMEIRP